jgi:molecular chaperone HscB
MYFEVLELAPALSLDSADLDKRFYRLSRKYHPDLFSRRPAAEQQEALDRSALLNDAYRTLKDPIKRALYVLKQEGFEADESVSKEVPPELLEEVFELNMALEESSEGPEIDAARKKFEGMRNEIDGEMRTAFAEWDGSHRRETLTQIRSLLNRRKYLTNLIEKTTLGKTTLSENSVSN